MSLLNVPLPGASPEPARASSTSYCLLCTDTVTPQPQPHPMAKKELESCGIRPGTAYHDTSQVCKPGARALPAGAHRYKRNTGKQGWEFT